MTDIEQGDTLGRMSSDDDGPQVWLLTHQEAWDDSGPTIVGAFPTEAAARGIADALAGTDDYDIDSEYAVESVPVLTGPLEVRVLWTELTCSLTVFWDGRVIGDNPGRPTAKVYIEGIPGAKAETVDVPAPVETVIRPMEHGYRLGVSLRVHGSDVEQVQATFARHEAEIIADPARATIDAWVQSEWLPRWTFGRGENAALAPHLAEALRAAGKGNLVFTHVDEGS